MLVLLPVPAAPNPFGDGLDPFRNTAAMLFGVLVPPLDSELAVRAVLLLSALLGSAALSDAPPVATTFSEP